MRIALIYDAVYPWMKGGGEKALWEIALGLSKKGHEIHLYGAKLWDGPSKMEKEGVFLHGIVSKRPFYRYDGKRSFLQPIEFALGLFQALWRTRQLKLDVIYCTVFPYYSVFSVAFFRWISGQKIPWTLAWLEVWGLKYWQTYLGYGKGLLGGVIEWLCAQCCDRHLVISPMQKTRLHSLLQVRLEEIEVIPRGMNFSQIPTTAVKVGSRVLYVGRFIDYKNIATVLRAWPSVLQAMPGARLRLIGSGPDENHLRAFSTTLGINATVEFCQPLATTTEILREIAAAEILLQPSTREGQSVVVLEAMAAKTLVMAARHPDSAVSDLIEHGKNGWLIDDPLNPASWAKLIVTVLQTPALFTNKMDSAQCFAASFDWEKTIIPVLEKYLQSITRPLKAGIK